MDHLEVIRRIIEYHRVIRGHLRKAGEAMPDRQAIFDLARQSPHWLLTKPETVLERQKELDRTLELLDEGLQKHFAYEEQYLPGLWGEMLMHALLMDHGRIKAEVADLRVAVSSLKLELSGKLDREEHRDETSQYADEIVSRCTYIHDRVARLREMIDDHAQREEVVLKWLEKALHSEAESGKPT